MSTLFSRQCEYALQAILYLALNQNGERIPIKILARRLNAPYHFLAKILQRLSHEGLLHSTKGPSGGFALATAAENISLHEIIKIIDGSGFLKNCVLGFPDCSNDSPCALHEQWSKSREALIKHLKDKTVAQMAKAMRKNQYTSLSFDSTKDIAAA